MTTRAFITVVNHTDPTVPDVRLDFPNREAARDYFRANKQVAKGEGCELRFCTEPITPKVSADTVFRTCTSCLGSGSVVTRFGGDGGCFPDEDTCPRCHGSGRIATPLETLPAKAS